MNLSYSRHIRLSSGLAHPLEIQKALPHSDRAVSIQCILLSVSVLSPLSIREGKREREREEKTSTYLSGWIIL